MLTDSTRQPEAFVPDADPNCYVPRLALELVLAELSEVIGKTPACAVLSGAAGHGKTLMMHVLRERLSGAFDCLYLPFGQLSPESFWSEVAVGLGLGSGDDDRGAVLGRACSLEADGSGLVLLIDDAGGMPEALQTDLIELCETPGFSLVLALTSDELAQQGALPALARRIDLGPPLTLAETRAYAQARLRQMESDGSTSPRLGARAAAEMHEASGGVPARLEVLLDAWRHSAATEDGAEQPAEPESEHHVGEGAPVLVLTDALQGFRTQLQRPLVQLGMAALLILLTAGFWMFALERSGGAASVGVPVDRFEGPTSAPKLSPAAQQTPATPAAPAVSAPAPAPAPGAESKISAKAPTSAAPAKRVSAAARPAPRFAQTSPPASQSEDPEDPVALVSARFPDEHVPTTLEVVPLAARPSGPVLNVNAAPWAKIQLDGKPLGETPLGELAIAPGRHQVTATLPDGRVSKRDIEARADDLYLVFE